MKRGQRVVAKHLIVYELRGGRRGEHYGVVPEEVGTVVKAIPTGCHWVRFGPVVVLCDPNAIKRIRETKAREAYP